ncbi:bactofilin family protein [Sinomicrobium sp.]
MFSESKRGKLITESFPQANRIEKDTRITGDITSGTDIRIDGKVEGNVKSSGRIVIGKDGSIDGKIECANADIEGRFSGDLKVAEQLSLKASAFVQGEVIAGRLSVEPGATFNASCSMQTGDVAQPEQEKTAKGKVGKTA